MDNLRDIQFGATKLTYEANSGIRQCNTKGKLR